MFGCLKWSKRPLQRDFLTDIRKASQSSSIAAAPNPSIPPSAAAACCRSAIVEISPCTAVPDTVGDMEQPQVSQQLNSSTLQGAECAAQRQSLHQSAAEYNSDPTDLTSQPTAMEEDLPSLMAVALPAIKPHIRQVHSLAPAGPDQGHGPSLPHSQTANSFITVGHSDRNPLKQSLEDPFSQVMAMANQAGKLQHDASQIVKQIPAQLAEGEEVYQRSKHQAATEAERQRRQANELTLQVDSLKKQLDAKDADVQELRTQAAAKDKECAQLQQTLQCKDQELADIKIELYDVESKLRAKEEDAASRVHELQAALARDTALHRDLTAARARTVQLQDEHWCKIEELQSELEDAVCKGRELLTFQGFNSTTASSAHLSAALKQLSDAAADAAKVLHKHAAAAPPDIFDLKRIKQQPGLQQQLDFNALRHAVMLQIACHIFSAFRTTHLTMTPACSLLQPATDQEALLLQLQLEKKQAGRWLQLVDAEADTPERQRFHGHLVAPTADAILYGLLSNHLIYVQNTDWSLIVAELLPKLKPLVAAAIKAQVICSAMHSQLVRLYVPGWQQQQYIGGINMCKAVPAAWERWPGVVPLNKLLMQAVKGLPVAAGAVPRGVEPPAVLCCEPAVLQLAERVGQLPEFGRACDVHLQPFQAIRKAKVCVAGS